ncbi:MAG: TolC family protein [Terriglobia bacterium]
MMWNSRVHVKVLAVTLVLLMRGAALAQTPATTSGTMEYGSGAASSSTAGGNASSAPGGSAAAALLGPQSPFLGSTPSGKATAQAIPLSLTDAIHRALRYNLGLLLSAQSSRMARGQRWEALSKLLPQVNASVTETRQEINLEALGFPANAFPGFPVIVGPFNTFDARAYLTAPILSLEDLRNERAASEDVQAAQYTYQDARQTVVLATGNAYLITNAGEARVASAQAEVATAQALYQQAVDRFHTGLSPQIDVLRAQVELQSRKQELIAAKNDYATEKLDLARVIGLPDGQPYELTTKTPYAPLQGVTLDKVLEDAYRNRPDYKAAIVRVHAAETRRKAVLAERYPSVDFQSNFGDIGLTPSNSHETFAIAGTVKIPVFQGGRVHGDLLEADAQVEQSKEQLGNLKSQIDYDVRTALMNLKTASDQVSVAQSNVKLAAQTLQQARDRFAAGVTDNIEVVQAQEAVARADENYISSLYAHNLAKVALARAAGIAEQAVLQYLGGK